MNAFLWFILTASLIEVVYLWGGLIDAERWQ